MKIIIAGAGRIGGSVAESLCSEGHDITIIEKDAETANNVSNNVDAICITGNACNPGILRDAGAETADLILAITESDETNMLCGTTACRLGTGKAVVRVRNPEYSSEMKLFKDVFGFSLIINPELECAREISRLIRFPGASRVDVFTGGGIEIAEYHVDEGSRIEGVALKDLRNIISAKVLVSLVERDGKAFIPNGEFVFRKDDALSLVGPDNELRRFFTACNAYSRKVKNVLIIGGGTTSVYLAKDLIKSGLSITIIEKDKSRCELLCDLVPDARIICGDATRSEVLMEEGVLTTDAFVALTDDDGENIITSIYAHHCGAGRIVTKVAHEHFSEVAESSDLDCVVTPKSIVTDQIVSFVSGMSNSADCSLELIYTLADGRAEALELQVFEDKRFTSIPLRELKLKPGILIVGIIRGGRSIVPDGDTVILPEDRIVVVTSSGAVRDIEDMLA